MNAKAVECEGLHGEVRRVPRQANQCRDGNAKCAISQRLKLSEKAVGVGAARHHKASKVAPSGRSGAAQQCIAEAEGEEVGHVLPVISQGTAGTVVQYAALWVLLPLPLFCVFAKRKQASAEAFSGLNNGGGETLEVEGNDCKRKRGKGGQHGTMGKRHSHEMSVAGPYWKGLERRGWKCTILNVVVREGFRIAEA